MTEQNYSEESGAALVPTPPTTQSPANSSHTTLPASLITSNTTTPTTSRPQSPSGPNASSANTKDRHRREVTDFQFTKTLGEGSYSTVAQAIDKHTNKVYAIKILDKRHIIKEKKVPYVEIEKKALSRMRHPGVVRLYWTFQDKHSLYFVLDLAPNGELLKYIRKCFPMPYDTVQFYTAQLVATLGYIHDQGVIHRDIKPENILMDQNMYINLTDFGTAKIIDADIDASNGDDEKAAKSFVGTAEYVSPELLTEKVTTKASDFWALGCIVYQLFTGQPPFKAGSEWLTFQKILKLEFAFPDDFPPLAKDFVARLLVLDPEQRLGSDACGGLEAIKEHPFFENIDWDRLFDPRTEWPVCQALPREEESDWSDDEIFGLFGSAEMETVSRQVQQMLNGNESHDGGHLLNLPTPHENVDNLEKAESRLRQDAEKVNGASQQMQDQDDFPWPELLREDEVVLRFSPVLRRKSIFSKKMSLAFTSIPRLLLIDTEKGTLKAEIPWEAKLKIELRGKKGFCIHSPEKTYNFEDIHGDAQGWVDDINRMLVDSYGLLV